MQIPDLDITLPPHDDKEPTEKCKRCGQRYTEENQHCPYCYHLSETELDDLKKRVSDEEIGNKKLGIIFFVAALIILALLIIFSITAVPLRTK